jgi:hypothetical protein
MSPASIRDRIRAAAHELENLVDSIDPAAARTPPLEGKWTIAAVVDHIAQTQVRAAEELRHLLAGRRPPLPPVYEALRSGAADWAPFEELVEGLKDANRALLDVLDAAPENTATGAPTAKTIMIVPCLFPDGHTGPQTWVEQLPWKEYALLQRLHLLDHRNQIKKLRRTASALESQGNENA